MSLQDKLNENRNMSELFQETKELNELMKSYIRVHMNEEMAKEVTIHNQLNQIQEKSDKVMSNMQSILNTQGKMLEENAENLQAMLINGHEEMEKSNNKTVKAVQEMQKSNVEELNQINNEISTSMTNIKRNLNETVKKAEQETRDLVSNKTWGTRDKYYRRIKIWCCYKCDYYSSSLFSSFLTKRGCLYGNPLALMANGFLQQSHPIAAQ